MRIAFLWNGIRYSRHRFKDGLYAALEHLKKTNDIGYFEPDDLPSIVAFKPDALLYWGALCEEMKPLVATYPYKKAICFAGGSIEPGNIEGFDLYFIESDFDAKQFTAFKKPWIRAFGVNEEIFQPLSINKEYDAIFFGAHARWKRNDLFAESLGGRGISVGQFQAHEKECYEIPQAKGVKTLDWIPNKELVTYINQSHTALNTSDVWGGGQRMTLEAMACNVPPIVMSDSPKNREFVEESGIGLIVNPNVTEIREAIEKLKGQTEGREYILSKWTSEHYAEALEKGLHQL